MTTKKGIINWEKRFDIESDFGFEWFISPEHYKKAKSFIQTELVLQKQKVVKEIEKSFEQLYIVKKDWENIEEKGNPNEQIETQIFGFNQAFKITDEILQRIKQTLNK